MRNAGRSRRGRSVAIVRVMVTGALALVVAGALLAHPPARVKRHTVSMKSMGFEPARLTVAAGDTVVWTNQDIVPHTATASDAWDTGQISQGRSATHVPAKKGEYSYVCQLHPAMKGILIVK